MKPQDYKITIVLSNTVNCRPSKEFNEDTGKLEDGIFIPIEYNNVNVFKGSVYLSYNAFAIDVPSNSTTHLLKPILKKEKVIELREKGFVRNKYVGKMAPVYLRKKN